MKLNKKGHFIVYVHHFSIIHGDYTNIAYECECEDIFHVIGEIYFRSLEHIKSVNFVYYKKASVDYCNENDIPIYKWVNKY